MPDDLDEQIKISVNEGVEMLEKKMDLTFSPGEMIIATTMFMKGAAFAENYYRTGAMEIFEEARERIEDEGVE